MNKQVKIMIIVLLTSLFANAQSEVNQVDAQGKPHGIWKKKYPNGNLRYQGEFKHGKEIGTFKFYAITGEKFPIVTKEYSSGTDLVKVRFYSKKNILESEGVMKNKKREGLWKYYFSDGKTLLSTEEYKDGLLDGELKIFYKSGKLTELSHYKNGKKNGQSLRYSDSGALVENFTYKEGIIDGPAVIYDKKGEIFARGNYEKGLKTGIWEFNMDGEMVKFDPRKKARKAE